MALLLTYQKAKLFNILVNKTIIQARTHQKPELELTDEMEPHIRMKYCEAGRRVLEKIGAHTNNIQVPYVQTSDGENYPEADSINFTVVTHDDSRDGVIVPLLDSSIMEFILSYVLNEWLKENGVPPLDNSEKKLQQIKRNIEYGSRTRRKYKTM